MMKIMKGCIMNLLKDFYFKKNKKINEMRAVFSKEETVQKRPIFPHCEKEFYALFITDTHSHLASNQKQFDMFLEDLPKMDVIFFLGDIDYADFNTLKTYKWFFKTDKYGILGNHDYKNILKENGVTNLHKNRINVHGVSFVGMEGSIKYKNVDAPMYTQEESIEIAKELSDADVFLTHDKAYIEGENVPMQHAGLKGITNYLKEKKPSIHFHGHIHENENEIIQYVPSYSIMRYACVKFSKDGISFVKRL